jgi:hypothetical protein
MPEELHKQAGGRSEACRVFDDELAAYLEGEERPAVAAHAELCRFCDVVLKDLQQLVFQARSRELEEPPARVWAHIRATLDAEGAFREPLSPWVRWLRNFEFLHPVPVAALASVIVIGAVLLGGPRFSTLRNPSPLLSDQSGMVATASNSAADEPAFRQTREQVGRLESSYREQETAIAPEVKADYQKSLDSLNSSIREAEYSMLQEPDNSVAREYLQAAYIRKAEVLASALETTGR